MFNAFWQHISMAWSELNANRLRTFLSLLGVSIGVFCVISVLTIFDSLQQNIQNNMQSLGSRLVYVGKFAWIPEGEGEYPMWKYKSRPPCRKPELKAVQEQVFGAEAAALCYTTSAPTVQFRQQRLENTNIFAVTHAFNQLQPIDVQDGRYFSLSEMSGPLCARVIVGHTVASELFGAGIDPLGKEITLLNQRMVIIGVLKKQGKTMSGFDFDQSIIMSYNMLNSIKNIEHSTDDFTDPMLMVMARNGYAISELKYEIKAALRAQRKLRPGEDDNFSLNELSSIQQAIASIFVNFNIFGWIIGLFSLLVGSFGIANIMFVSVKERTPYIGIKKALGAPASTILIEFLIESMLLCLLGGAIGMILVYVLTLVLSGPVGFPVFISFKNFFTGVFISLLVGVLSGFWPARKAASLNPVVAIRS
ncbi:MAG: ABC transporter permease [Chitinophagaceae bacterium]